MAKPIANEELSMKKMLIINVGSGTAGNESSLAESIAKSIKLHAPCECILIPSLDDVSQLIAETVREKISDISVPCIISENCFEQPYDLQNCREVVSSIIDSLQFDRSHGEISINLTSGTKQMCIGAMMAALDKNLANVAFIGGEFYRGSVVEGTEALILVSMDSFFKDRALADAKQLASKGALWASVQLLEKFKECQLQLQRYRLLALWQDLNFTQARQIAAQKEMPLELRKHFSNLFSTPLPNNLSIADTVASGIRLVEWHFFNDALIRLYQALEIAGRERLHLLAGIKPIGSTYELDAVVSIPGMTKKQINKFRAQSIDNDKVVLGQYAIFECLEALGEDSGKYYHSNGNFIELLRKRNEFVHTGKTPSHDLVKEVLEAVLIFLDQYYPEINYKNSNRGWSILSRSADAISREPAKPHLQPT
jgi:hypothetical protein